MLQTKNEVWADDEKMWNYQVRFSSGSIQPEVKISILIVHHRYKCLTVGEGFDESSSNNETSWG